MKKAIVAALVAAVILAAGAGEARAQWVKTGGPESGWVSSILIAGSKVFAGTDAGLFVLESGGGSWAPAGKALAEREIQCLAMVGQSLFAGSDWPDTEGIPPAMLKDLADSLAGGVLRSDDGGLTWMAAHAGLPVHTAVQAFAVIGTDLYVGCDVDTDWDVNGGLFASGDLGKTWRDTGSMSALFLAAAGKTLYAATMLDGFRRSLDGGRTWTSGGAGFPEAAAPLALVAAGANLVLGSSRGLFVSKDDAAHWTEVTAGLPAKAAVRRLAVSGDRVFAATAGSVYASDDLGLSWKEVRGGLPAQIVIWSLAAGPNDVFAGTEGQGVWRLPLAGAAAGKRP